MPYGLSRKCPAPRSRIAPNTLGESGRGAHSHSTDPLEEIRQAFSQSGRNSYAAIGGEGSGEPLDAYGTGAVALSCTAAPFSSAGVARCRTIPTSLTADLP